MKKKTYFDIIDLEDGDASVLLAQAKVKKDSRDAKYRRLNFCKEKYSPFNAKHNSVCQSCEKKRDFLRFDLDADMFLCYDCFYEGMKISGEFYSLHGRAAEDMDGFLDDAEWEELWAEENPHMIYDEEDDKYYDKNAPVVQRIKEVKKESTDISETMKAFEIFQRPLYGESFRDTRMY